MRPGSSLTALSVDAARTLRELALAGLLFPFNAGSAVCGHGFPQLTAVEDGTPRQRTPVVLVHGYGGTRATWWPLEARLRRAGFQSLDATVYSPLARCVGDVARTLVRDGHAAMERAGTDRLPLVVHSLGGVVVRYAVQELGLEPHVGTAVTVAAPHRGTLAALLGVGTVAASLVPGSRVLEDLRRRARASSVRWVSYFSDRDLVVRPYSSRLEERVLRATNVLVPGVGHLGIVRSPLFLDSVARLLADDRPAGQPAGSGPGTTGTPTRAAA